MSEDEYIAVSSFLGDLLYAAEKQAAALRELKPTPGSNYIGNQWVYWDNVASGFKWAIKLAQQQRV